MENIKVLSPNQQRRRQKRGGDDVVTVDDLAGDNASFSLAAAAPYVRPTESVSIWGKFPVRPTTTEASLPTSTLPSATKHLGLSLSWKGAGVVTKLRKISCSSFYVHILGQADSSKWNGALPGHFANKVRYLSWSYRDERKPLIPYRDCLCV